MTGALRDRRYALPVLSTRRTLLGGLAVLFAAVAGRTLAMAALGQVLGAGHDGLLVATGILTGSLAGTVALSLVCGERWRTWLALTRPSAAHALAWFAAGAALIALNDVAAWARGTSALDAAWVELWPTAPAWLFALALMLTSVFEELFFRGFLLSGLAATRLGRVGAAAVTAALFALAHFPPDAWHFADVFLAGLVFAAARFHTGSSLAGVAPHVAGNLKVLFALAG